MRQRIANATEPVTRQSILLQDISATLVDERMWFANVVHRPTVRAAAVELADHPWHRLQNNAWPCKVCERTEDMHRDYSDLTG
jgi:hypothetical protein